MSIILCGYVHTILKILAGRERNAILILFARTVILYALVFAIIRFTGKRQISDLQPFDLIVTLLIADLASEPAADTGIPLLYGVVPILALFLVQRLFAFAALKNEGVRTLICGTPLLLVKNGVVQTQALRDARYTLDDLIEQLRSKDVFDLADVSYAILETNGSLSVLLKGQRQTLTFGAAALPPPADAPPFMLVLDGKLHHQALKQAGYDERWLTKQLARLGDPSVEGYLFVLLSAPILYTQTSEPNGSQVRTLSLEVAP